MLKKTSMLALFSVWTGLLAMIMAAAMLVRRSLMSSQVWFTISIYAVIFSLTFAGLALWGLRKEYSRDPGVLGRRSQCYVGVGLSGVALAILYGLFFQTVE